MTSDLQLWLIAVASFVACSVAFATLPLAKPGSKQRLGLPGRVAVAPLPASAGAAFVAVSCAARSGDDVQTGLQLYSMAMGLLVVLRIVFAGWLKRATKEYYGDL